MVCLQKAFVFAFVILFCFSAAWSKAGKRHGRHQKKKKSFIEPSPQQEDKNLRKKILSKKSAIEAVAKALETGTKSPKNKRGFLATLATLLNDAEQLTGRRNQLESGLSSFHTVPPEGPKSTADDSKQEEVKPTNNSTTTVQQTSSETNEQKSAEKPNDDVQNQKANAESKSEKVNDEGKSEKELPTPDDVKSALNESNKEFAPIFAMYHGKIVPLGKLPDTSFKKSHTEDTTRHAEKAEEAPHLETHAAETNSNVEKETPKTAASQVTGSRRSFEKQSDEEAKPGVTKTVITPTEVLTAEKSLNKSDDPTKMSKLQQYLKNLDGHVPATGGDQREHVAKDEVVFPQQEETVGGATKSDILNHIKGLVLDNGKIVTVKGNHLADEQAEAPEAQPKFSVAEDGSLVKASTEDTKSSTRDQTSEPKTVALSLDALKDLLKKNDNKVSLANLLNKPTEQKEAPVEDEDPGTIEDFAAGGLKSHNSYRAKHHSDALIWSDELASKAQKLAESLADKKTLEIAKDLEKEGYGENVAKVWATFKDAGEAATKMWYTESGNYRFDDPHLDENTGQFAQVVWKSTKELGMGVAKSIDDVNNKYVYVTALYRPPGNIEATLRDNVLPTGNNTVDVYTTFFKRAGVVKMAPKTTSAADNETLYSNFFKRENVANSKNIKRSKLNNKHPSIVHDNIENNNHYILENEN